MTNAPRCELTHVAMGPQDIRYIMAYICIYIIYIIIRIYIHINRSSTEAGLTFVFVIREQIWRLIWQLCPQDWWKIQLQNWGIEHWSEPQTWAPYRDLVAIGHCRGNIQRSLRPWDFSGSPAMAVPIGGKGLLKGCRRNPLFHPLNIKRFGEVSSRFSTHSWCSQVWRTREPQRFYDVLLRGHPPLDSGGNCA